ncbi:hypothetical protein TELCIR_03161 [Teladorsagia circumcincta]|uniref:C-type lectin domain-containing protein n=1 Tax=Teladorsagia circumcincta TaxID=45464 RepID=A0A2G9UX59_TELCI|nr:hypothetical protein TELCIR_03161 [Teladorsagia circumcincta]
MVLCILYTTSLADVDEETVRRASAGDWVDFNGDEETQVKLVKTSVLDEEGGPVHIQAEKFCQHYGAHSLSFHTEAEKNFLLDLLMKVHSKGALKGNTPMLFLGLERAAQWLDGSSAEYFQGLEEWKTFENNNGKCVYHNAGNKVQKRFLRLMKKEILFEW